MADEETGLLPPQRAVSFDVPEHNPSKLQNKLWQELNEEEENLRMYEIRYFFATHCGRRCMLLAASH